MVIYKCELCNFSSKLKSNYNRHLKTIKHLNKKEASDHALLMSTNEHKMSTNEHKKNENEHKMSTNEHKKNENEKKFSCSFCDDKFKTQANKRRHELHYCKQNNAVIYQQSINKDKIITQLKNEKTELYKKMDTLLQKVGDTTIHNTQNIQLNNYGNEDLTHITEGLKTELLSVPYGMIPKMIEAVHFSDEKPENKNIIIPNKNQNFIKIYKDNKWIYKDKDETLTDLVDSKYMIMDEHYEVLEEGECVSNNIKSRFIKFKKYYDEGDKEMVEALKKECELVLLNNR